jgi:hypothetical protein
MVDQNQVVPDDAPRSIYLRLVPWILTLLILGVIFWRIPFRDVYSALDTARLLPFLALTAGFNVLWCFADTLVLTKMVTWFHGAVRYKNLLPVRATSYLLSIINMQLAQGAVAVYIHRRFRTPLGEIASTMVMLILLEATVLVLFTVLGALAFPGGMPREIWIAALGLAFAWLGLLVLAGGDSAIGRRFQGVALLRTFRRSTWPQGLLILGLKAVIFMLSLLVHYEALPLFGIEIPWRILFVFLPVVYFVSALPITVGQLGTAQAAWIFFFGTYSSEADLLAYSLAYQASFVLSQTALGLIFLTRAYRDLLGPK